MNYKKLRIKFSKLINGFTEDDLRDWFKTNREKNQAGRDKRAEGNKL